MQILTPNILLASSSKYRRTLLQKILPNFKTCSPSIDEKQLGNEHFEEMAERLAKEKALALCSAYPDHLIIGSDQVACLSLNQADTQLTKPLTVDNCFKQLKQCQGKTVHFFTGLCLINSRTMFIQTSVERYETKFRQLNDQQIQHYIEREPALDCAGGFKMEGLGITLFEHIRGDDPNTLIGLPLIQLITMLKNEGVNVL